MKEKIKKYIGEIMIIIGVGLFTFFVTGYTRDYYSLLPYLLVSLSTMLMATGILVIRRREREYNSE